MRLKGKGLTLYQTKQFWGMSKFKGRADDKFGEAEIIGFVFERVGNIVGKGENAVYQHFLPFVQCLQKASYPGLLKGRTVW